MQRKAYAPGREAAPARGIRPRASMVYVPVLVAGLLAALATGCTDDSGAEGSAGDSKPGNGTQAAAQPGKYRTLLEPCGSVGRSTLRDLLPGVTGLPETQQRKALRGTAASTFDTDRRVGCGWRADSPDASHTLSLDFERVVSYDPAVSDSDRAQEVFLKKYPTALRPASTPSDTAGTGSATADPAGANETAQTIRTEETSGTEESAGTSPSSTSSQSPSDSSSAPPDGTDEGLESDPADLEPRILDDLGDAAFINDTLTPAGAGSTAQRRTVSVAFRTSNVIVTVVYTEQSGRITSVPDSKELQDKARSLAGKLAGKLGG
ncbi:hypothetical protein GCM10010232_57960 [Streptomyces amakusaensis]|uniref:DUF3558 domain-containing protein n=1 Tax=Streptomyces amakusaensis TaxID=67271 RepID=A0ABW0AP36_9ACTN